MSKLAVTFAFITSLTATACLTTDDDPTSATEESITVPAPPSGTAYDAQGRRWTINGYGIDVFGTGGNYRFTVGSTTIPGAADGTGAAARFRCPTTIQPDASGGVNFMIVSEPCRCRVRLITTSSQVVTTIASTGC